MSPTIRFLLASTLLAHAACATEDAAPTATKDAYRDGDGKTDAGSDVCAQYHWYGDGECDAFCPERDSDCATDARTPELAHASDALASKIVEAKFELDDAAQLSLSLCRVKDFQLDAERTELGELSGDPVAAPFAPAYAKFDVPDEEHVTKAARDLSLVQAAGMNLRSAVVKAQSRFPAGFVYWAIPTRQGTRAGYGIYVLDAQNQPHYLFLS